METEQKGALSQDEKIDEAGRESFPASDPAAIGTPTSTERAGRPADRKAPVISKEDIERARRGEGHAQNDSSKRDSA